MNLSNKLESSNIFEDFFTSQVDRGYIPGKYNTYFYRYIGYTDEKKYNNDLAYLDKELKSNANRYLLFTSSIPIPFDQDLTQSIVNELVTMDVNNLEQEDINLVANTELNTRIKKALSVVIPIAIQKENFMNQNVRNNFITKIMIWCNEFLDGNKIVWDDEISPKVVFYGQIKRHESYLLILFSLIGFDVLYINSFDDSVFEDVDKDNKYSNIVHNTFRGALQEYKFRVSKGEIIPVMTTIAQKATKEIESSIFNNDTGVFKPWQFSNGTTSSILLNSTIDELGIYWEQASKLRPGFKVEGKKVYTPNFFSKVNGVDRDISEYYALISKLKHSKNTLFTENVGLIEPEYTKQQMFSLAFVMDSYGLAIEEDLKKHELYKYGSLKSEVQTFIIDKINELLNTPSIFVNGIDKNKRLKIVATILSMSEHMQQMIESFDYTAQVPKIVIYLSNKTDFTEEDSILLTFFNRVGFDIVILSPCSANNIEKAISSTYMMDYRLDEVAFDLKLKDVSVKQKVSFFGKLFG